MRLIIIRHGKAERESPTGRDADRALAPRGHRQAAWLGEHLRSVGLVRVLTSPAARAASTASIVAELTGLSAEPEPLLGLGSSAGAIIEELLPALEDSVAIVGHNPTLSDVVSILTGGVGGVGAIELRTGQAAVVELGGTEPGSATLCDLLRGEDAE